MTLYKFDGLLYLCPNKIIHFTPFTMKSNKFSILSFVLFILLITSCTTNDPFKELEAWKNKNDAYFTNMKDSTGYTLYTIPASSGGGSYYYKITTAGEQNSISPLSTQKVKVNYRGMLVTGEVFDQSYTTALPTDAAPRTFSANGVIWGWTQNLIQMKVGETRSIVLPQQLGYGSGGNGSIPSYSTTVWVVRLVEVVP